ncbi:MAG: hypothetical protein WKI04_13365 [Ferruginibacter sp.]
MKQFKIIDIIISITLIAGFSIYWLIKQDTSFIIAYCVVGTWQGASMIIHVYNKCFVNKKGSRYYYHWVALTSIVTMPLFSYRILFFTAPFMAVYYTYLCYHEVTVKMQRPLSLLK